MTVKYPILFLDLDNTLLDFGAAETNSFYHTCKAYGIDADEGLLAEYHTINAKLWKQLEEGCISKGALVVERFVSLFALHRIPCDPVAFNRDYLDNLALKNVLIDGALDICRQLSQHCKLIITSNGVSRAQHRRLAGTPLLPYLSEIVISDAAGAEKPAYGFFEYALSLCGSPPRETVLMVGDSLSADIAGGNGAGIDTCWFNPRGNLSPENPVPTYEIRSLHQLPSLVLTP